MVTMEGRVSEGAKWMDRHVPGWHHHVRPEDLAMESCTRCVLGQSLGHFDAVFRHKSPVLAWFDDDSYTMPLRAAWIRAHGFDTGDVITSRGWGPLRDLWVTEILSRRFAEQAAPVETPVSVAS